MSQFRSLRRILAVAALSVAVMLGSFAGVARAADDGKDMDHAIVCELKWDSVFHKWKLDCRVVYFPKQ
jgi:hypothetical protein